MKTLPGVLLLGALCGAMLVLPAMMSASSRAQDAALQDALAERAAAAKQVMDEAASLERAGRVAFEQDSALVRRLQWSRRAAVAAAEAGSITMREALSLHLAKARALLVAEEELHKAGRRGSFDLQMGRYEVADAEVQLARLGK